MAELDARVPLRSETRDKLRALKNDDTERYEEVVNRHIEINGKLRPLKKDSETLLDAVDRLIREAGYEDNA